MTSLPTYFASLSEPDRQFLYWFMWFNFDWGTLPSDRKPPQKILEYLTDNTNDKSIDAFYFDDENTRVYAVQSKYTADWETGSHINLPHLNRSADAIRYFEYPNKNNAVYKNANKKCRRLLGKALAKVRAGYKYRITFVSNALPPLPKDLDEFMEQKQVDLRQGNFEVISRAETLRLYLNYLEDHSPPIPPQRLKIFDEKYLVHEIETKEPRCRLTAWIAVSSGNELVKIYHKYGERIFDANVRSFLGSREGESRVNAAIKKTLTTMPELFFFKNSGITMSAQDVRYIPKEEGGPAFDIADLQVINGQQTTRVLAESLATDAKVMLTIIKRVEL